LPRNETTLGCGFRLILIGPNRSALGRGSICVQSRTSRKKS